MYNVPMQINGSIPFHIARAYGVTKPQAARPSAPAMPVQPTSAPRAADSFQPTNAPAKSQAIQSLIAGQVNKPIDFTPAAQSNTGALQLYTRSADRIEAATSLHVGRSCDVKG